MNRELCLHTLHRTDKPFFFACDCGETTQQLCAVCQISVDTNVAKKCGGTCDSLICSRCMFDCTRTNDTSAQCHRCTKTKSLVFEDRYWGCSVRLFFVDTHNVQRVIGHMLQNIFLSKAAAFESVPKFLVACYPESKLVAELAKQFNAPESLDESDRKEIVLSVEDAYLGSERVRMEIHLKSLIKDSTNVLPKQLKPSTST